MPTEAPAMQDQPATPLDRILSEYGVPRSLPPELQDYARERGLVLEEEGEPEFGANPDDGSLEPDDEGRDAPDDGDEESFMDFDPSQIPEFETVEEAREWVGKRHGEMNKHFTQRMQTVSEGQRNAEEAEALLEGLRDPETMPHYLRLLGIDPSDPEMMDRLGIPTGGDEDDDLDDLEPDAEERVDQLEKQLQQEREEREAADEEKALDEIADQELEGVEEQWGRKLDEDEDAFLRRHAESNPGPDGLPDYAAAAKVLKGLLSRREKEWAKRRSEQGGRGAPGGKPGGKALDPNKEEDRLLIGAAAAEREMASQE